MSYEDMTLNPKIGGRTLKRDNEEYSDLQLGFFGFSEMSLVCMQGPKEEQK